MPATDPPDVAADIAFAGLRRSVVRSAGAAAVSNTFAQLLQFAAYLVLARLAPPAVFGEFAAACVLLAFGEIFSESGMTAALLQRSDDLDEAAATALASTMVGGTGLALVALGASPLIGWYFHSSTIGLAAAALSGHLVINGAIGVPATLLQKRFALRRWAVEPVAVVVFGVVSAVCLSESLGVWGLVIGWYATSVTRAIGYWFAARWKPQLSHVSIGMWKELARYARHILTSEAVLELMRITNTAVIGRSLGPASLGQFRFGWRLVTQAATPVVSASAYTLQPALVRLSDDPERTRRAVLAAFRTVSLFAFPLALVFVPLGEPLALILFGDHWRRAGEIMSALAGMGLATGMAAVSLEIFKARGRPQLLPKLNGLWAVLAIGLTIGLSPFGARGIAFGWSASTTVFAVAAMWLVPTVVDVRKREIAAVLAPPFVSSLVMTALLVVLNRLLLRHAAADLATFGKVTLELLAGGAAYLGCMALVAPKMLAEMRGTLVSVIRRGAP